MQDDLQVIIPILAGSIVLVGLVTFIIFSALQYRKTRKIHEYERSELKNRYAKEVLEATLEVKQETLQLVSEEIHDNIGQVLSFANMQLHIAKKANPSDKLDVVSEHMTNAINSLRNVSHMISQNDIEGSNLIVQLEKLVNELNEIDKFVAEFINSLSDSPLIDSQSVLVVYRMMQELTNNALKYSQAKNVTISLQEMNTDRYELSIEDDGIGFSVPEAKASGNGLQNLQRRAENIGAELHISSVIGEGTKTTILIPIVRNE